MKKKLLLFLMLLVGSVGTCLAQYSAKYDFSNTSVSDWAGFSFQNGAASFTVNLNGGYNDAYGDTEMTVVIPNFTFNATGTNPMIFAFNSIQVKNSWEQQAATAWRSTPAGDDNLNVSKGIKNMSPQNNVFSVLNLRAGEIVKIKSLDNNGILADATKKPLKNRFIVEWSPNAIDNKPWANPDAIDNSLLTYTQEFIMTEDGNLDLKVSPWLKIIEIEIVSNYTNFQQGRAHVGTDINVTIPNRKVSDSGVLSEDYTSRVGTNYTNWNGATQMCPAQNWLVENYGNQNAGTIMQQTITGLTNGIYTVELYATSHRAWTGNLSNTRNDLSYVFATAGGNTQQAFFPAQRNSGFISGEPYVNKIENITVTDGNLTLGLGVTEANQVEWHCIQIKSLTLVGTLDGIRYAQAEPVVLYRGDLTPGTVTTTKNSDGNWNINISGFTGKQYTDGYWEGGSIIVMLDQTMYTYTVPYNVNKDGNAEFASWNFWQNPLYIGRASQPVYESLLSHDISEGTFGLVYENTDNREPLYEYNNRMYGQNAYFHPETAGLIIETDANKKYGILNENTSEEPDGNRYLGLKNGGSLTIPDLKAGDEVWVYFDHFGASSALNHDDTSIGMKVTNARDALGKKIEDEVITAGGSTWGPSFFNSSKDAKIYVGAMHFYAYEDGDMKFTPSFYTNFNILKIAYIRLVRHNPQNIISKTNSILWFNDGGPNNGYEMLTTQDAAGNYTNTYGSWGLHECGRGQSKQRYQVLEASGNISAYEINQQIDNANYQLSANGIGAYDAMINGVANSTNSKKFRYTTKKEPTFGSFLLRAMDYDFNGKYCFDYADRVIAVGYRQTMNYPYTWDFTDILNKETGNSQAEYDLSAAKFRPEGETQPVGGLYSDTQTYNGNTIWMNDTTSVWVKYDNVISLQNARIRNENNRTLSSGTQLFASDTYIEEAAGLGWATINMDAGFNGSIQILNKGVKIQSYNGWETRLFIPAANKTGRIYIRGEKIKDGKGFTASAYKNAAMGPNTFKKTPDTRVALTPLMEEGTTQSIFHYEANFGTFIEGQQAITETKHYDDYLEAIVGGESTQMEERLGSDRTVDNPEMLYEESGYDSRIVSRPGTAYHEYYPDGTPNYETAYEVTIIESDDNIYLNDADTHDRNLALFDKNVTLCTEIDGVPITDQVYTNFIYTVGSGKSNGRYLKVSLPASDYGFKVTVVGRAQASRQINVFAGTSWGNKSDALATMIVRDHVSAKTLTAPAGTTNLLIGSDNSGVEIYAIYVEENKTNTETGTEPWAGYVDVAASDGGVTLYLNDIIIEKIGYSTDVKTINDIGWASESRDHYIDHSLTEYFTTDPVKAYVATGTAKKGSSKYINAVSLTALEYPMQLSEGNGDPKATTKTGCVMYNTNNESVDGGVYLFVPAIWDYMNDDYITNANFKGDVCTNGSPISTGAKSHANADQAKLNSMSGNMMVANLTGQTVPYSGTSANMTNYVLSYRFIDGEGKAHPAEGEAKTERFVRVGTGGATGSANTAYLQLPTADVKPEDYVGAGNLIIIFDGENQGTDPDGIEELYITTGNGTQGTTGSDSYYTLSGQKVNNPTKPGVYVKNGKKVFVK